MAKDNKKKVEQITDMEVDFAQWYTDVCRKADVVMLVGSNPEEAHPVIGMQLRAAVERELYGAKAPWQHDEEHYAFCGGGFPLYVNGEFRGAAIISGLPHLKDHALLCETVKAYWESKKK